MRRTIYIDDVVIDESMLNNTERSKVEEILKHHNALGSEGIIFGLDVNPAIANPQNIDITSGSAILPNKEIVSLEEDVINLPIATNVFSSLNLVLVSYSEELSIPKPNQLGQFSEQTYATTSGYISVLDVESYQSLPENDSDPNVQTKSNSLIIAIVVGNGENTSLLTTSVIKPEPIPDSTNFSDFRVLRGVVVKSTNVSSTSNLGQIKYDLNNQSIRFVSPNNENPPEDNDLGSEVVQINNLSEEELINFTLTDPDVPDDFIVVDIFKPLFPDNIRALDPDILPDLINDGVLVPIFTNPTTNVDINQLSSTLIQSFIDNETFSNYIFNESIGFESLYSQNLKEISEGVNVETRKASATDILHRSKIGDGQTNKLNPHGLSISDVIQLFDSFPGSLELGANLLATGLAAVIPRIVSPASARSKYTLFFQNKNEAPGTLTSPLRFYINSSTEDGVDFSGISITLNAKYDPESDLWQRENLSASSVRLKIVYNKVVLNVASGSAPSFSDDDWGPANMEVTEIYTRFFNSLGIVPKSNNQHNDAENYRGLLNIITNPDIELEDNEEDETRPYKVLVYEDLKSNLGPLRIYFGSDQNRRAVTDTVGEGEDAEEVSLPDDTIDFTVNAKPILGSINWEKEDGQPSYMFRYRFSDSTLVAKRYVNLAATGFTDGEFEEVPIDLKGGIEATENSVITGNFVFSVTSGPPTTPQVGGVPNPGYENPVTRYKFVSVKEIGWNPQFGGDTFAAPRNEFSDIPSDYVDNLQLSDSSRAVMVSPIPLKVIYENRGRNGEVSSTPKYVWNGPGRGLGKAPGGLSDLTFPFLSHYPSGTVHRFLIPLIFEEPTVDLVDIRIPFDFDSKDYTDPSFGIPQIWDEFGLGDHTTSRWFDVNFWLTDIVTGSASLVSPSPSVCRIAYEDLTSGSDPKMIRITSSDLVSPYLRINHTGRNFVYIHLTTNVSTYTPFTDSGPWDGETHNAMRIGSPYVKYQTRYVT